MATRKHLLVLLIAIFPLVAATKNLYCETEQIYDYYPKFNVICRNTSIQNNKVITVAVGQGNRVVQVQLISVTADLQANALQNFPIAQDLIIFNSDIRRFSLKSSVFTLKVSNSIFPKVTSTVLKGCKKVSVLTFMSNFGLQFEAGAFKHMRVLYELVIMNQTLPRIKRNLFKGLENLQHLTLTSNNIREIENDAFLDLLNLRELYLDANPINSLGSDITGLTKLTGLSLFNTNVKRLDFKAPFVKSLTSICLSRQLLASTSATELIAKVPNLYLVMGLSEELRCPEVSYFVDELLVNKKAIRLMPITAENSFRYKKFVKPSMCYR